MPIYEYQCTQCGKRVEAIQRFADAPLTVCEHCGGELKKLVSAPAFQFKGTGWYVTDYAGKKGAEGRDAKEGKQESGGESSSAGTAESASSSSSSGETSSKHSSGKESSSKDSSSESGKSGGSSTSSAAPKADSSS